MNTLVDVLVVLAVLALVVRRHLGARPLESGGHPWLAPSVLLLLALRDPALVDRGHPAASVSLLAASVAASLAMGCVWGWTVRLWRAEDGRVWSRGTTATAAAWAGLIAIRAGLYGLGVALHVHQDASALLLGLAVMLPARALVVGRRARGLRTPYRFVPAA